MPLSVSRPFCGQYGDEVQLDNNGAILASTWVTILNPDSTLATLYTDLAGSLVAANPVQTDLVGNLLFYAAPGPYKLSIGGIVVAYINIDLPVSDQTNPRTPTAHAASHGPGGSDVVASISVAGSGSPAASNADVIHNTGNETKSGTLTATDFIAGGHSLASIGSITVAGSGAPAASNADVLHNTGNESKSGTLTATDFIISGRSVNSLFTGGSNNNVYNVKAYPYNAVGDGITDDTTAITTANNDAHVSGGTVFFPPGIYKIISTCNITSAKVNWVGVDSTASYLLFYNTGNSINWKISSFVADQQVGRITGLTINGTNTTAPAVGIYHSDSMNGFMDDLHVINYAGAGDVGVKLENVSQYTEGTEWGRLLISNNTIGILFTVSGTANNSFGYQRLKKVRLVVNASQVGVRLENRALVYNGEINISANCAAGSTFMQIAGVTGTGITGMANCLYCIQAEVTGGGAANGIVLSEYGTMTGSGVVDLSSGSFTSTIGTGHVGTFDLSGWIKLPGTIIGTLKMSATIANTATAGSQTLPSNPVTFLVVAVNGANFKIPLYNV